MRHLVVQHTQPAIIPVLGNSNGGGNERAQTWQIVSGQPANLFWLSLQDHIRSVDLLVWSSQFAWQSWLGWRVVSLVGIVFFVACIIAVGLPVKTPVEW